MDQDLPPELDDFSEVISKIKPNQSESSSQNIGDYTKTTEELQQEMQEKLNLELKKQEQQKQAEEQKA